MLVPDENLTRFEGLVNALAEKGLTDPGAEGCNRVVRIPGSRNLKPGRDNFASRLTVWEPAREWTLDELANAFGVDMLQVRFKSIVNEARVTDAELQNPVHDPLLVWLTDNGHVLEDRGTEWIDVRCPWHEEHSAGGGENAGYSPLGRGEPSSGWAERRSFSCMHEHCKDRHFREFMDWGASNGAPIVASHDPLPWYQARYYYVSETKQVADMLQRPAGGTWLWEPEAWDLMQRHVRIEVPGANRPLTLKNAFLNSRDTTRLTTAAYVPGGDEIATRNGQEVVNLYVSPRHAETEERPDIFLDHIEYLMPAENERETFLDWLAFKFQRPDTRSYAVVLVADDAFGIGRSWIGQILSRALQGHVHKATLGQLIGKGTQADADYNDWAVDCQFLIVDEARDVSKDDFFSAYETFKQRVDTSPVEFRANKKYGKTRNDMMWFNALIFTNHADAMVVPEDDRRIAVFVNPTVKQSEEYYEQLHKTLEDDGEAQRVYWYLMHRDVSKFQPASPPMTPGKIAMIQASRSPSEEIIEYLVETMEGDLVTRKTLHNHVRRAARNLGHDGVDQSPGATVRRIWRKLGSLKPGEKNGFRILIDTDREEIRAVRGSGEWISKLPTIERDEILAQVRQNSAEPVQFVVSK